MREVRYVKGLDGLRAIAVILVFLSHKGHVLAVDVGKLGVWTFFLISGFLIVGELHRNREAVECGAMTRRHALALFLAKRALRIFPVYYLLLAALAIAHALFYQRGVNLGLAWHAVFLSNYWIGVVKDGWPGSTSHFWSLAVEQQFYLIAPLALLAVPAARHVALGVAAVALCALAHLALYASDASPVLIYAFSPWNFALIALGGLGAVALADRGPAVVRRIPPGWLGAAGVVFFLALPALTTLPDVVTGLADLGLSASLGSLMLWIVTEPDHPAVALLDWAPLVYLGTISYGFYLFHNLIPARFGVMPALFARVPLPAIVRDALPELLQFALAVLLAHLSWRYLEKRLLDFKKPVAAMLARHFVARPGTSPR
ncbi:acyltransferase family protein [Burkholderia pseudomultivorans]|uniref:Acyltransferase n=1 Tax=Burkholderia pseudomultivorans TaxID=1207504 RepID=A0A132EEF5_9BURK|nr:acyltransferase [Burkholderia pseudomultivorans]KWF27155.1 acyltransferase [Burkholderia pseudomultivorans]MDR8727429.1 O-acetyltransferase OatA [Burkholderia pseudomultivorans]MDR8732479.1 O-acetyltransferase OatA [Burkholderia pseudomultivorans]MDR8739345.1 O-acetyltransferase OatA [Burkholderia pseudomultivorans]MDR8753459.1 O-acetyltransferase OatA [Burkholderia pseudomultivorans]